MVSRMVGVMVLPGCFEDDDGDDGIVNQNQQKGSIKEKKLHQHFIWANPAPTITLQSQTRGNADADSGSNGDDGNDGGECDGTFWVAIHDDGDEVVEMVCITIWQNGIFWWWEW